MSESGRRLSEEDARRVWKRAAELQARAADAASRGALPVPAERSEGLALTEVASAAIEAGIGPEYVQLALAELETSEPAGHSDSGLQRFGRRMAGEPFDAIETARVIPASPQAVYESMMKTFTAPPFGLVLTDTKGTVPFVDDVLVFDVEAPSLSQTPFQSRLNIGDVKRLYVMLRPLPGRADACHVRIRAPFERRRLNLFFGGLFTAAGGVAGSGIGVAIGAVAGAAGAALLAVPAAVGLLGAAAGMTGFRAIYGWSTRGAGRALEQLLGTLAAGERLRIAGLRPPTPVATNLEPEPDT